jgi:hypothetical protein
MVSRAELDYYMLSAYERWKKGLPTMRDAEAAPLVLDDFAKNRII